MEYADERLIEEIKVGNNVNRRFSYSQNMTKQIGKLGVVNDVKQANEIGSFL